MALCECRPRNVAVFNRNCNYSAFSGYHRTPSDYSLVLCVECGASWRTKARYVDRAPDWHAGMDANNADHRALFKKNQEKRNDTP